MFYGKIKKKTHRLEKKKQMKKKQTPFKWIE
jgi:hypothetical protein